jgi:putative membrane protein insertion efficiency factor
MIGGMVGALSAFVAFLVILPVRFYQTCLRWMLPPLCRYSPSCSEYFILAVRKYGPCVGAWKGICRICRCHPWGGFGEDPP